MEEFEVCIFWLGVFEFGVYGNIIDWDRLASFS